MLMSVKTNSPPVSVLILNYNGIEFTRRCIKSLQATTYPNYEILILDNGSNQPEGEMLRKEFGKYIRLHQSPRNVGYAAGMNRLLAEASGTYVMLINNDMEFDPKWLTELVTVLNSHRNITAVQPKIKDIKNKAYFEYASAAGGMIDRLWFPFARGRLFFDVEKDNGQYDRPVYIAWAGVLLIRKSILTKIGLFNPIFFHNMEDLDLSFRIYGTGGSIAYAPRSVVYHFGGAVIAKNPANKSFFVHRNNLILIFLYWRVSTLFLIIPIRMMLDVMAAARYVYLGHPKMAWSVVRAYWGLLPMLGEIKKARKLNQSIIRHDRLKSMPTYNGSLVWDYYIRGIRKFSDLRFEERYYKD